jgi:hypothetical protein
MDDTKVWGIFFGIGFVLGSVIGGIFWSFACFEDNFKHGYGQALIDTKEGNPPRYKLFYRGDGTMAWIKNNVEVK